MQKVKNCVRLFGLAGGCVVALMGSCFTVYAWGHPYALVVFTAEAAAVYALSRRISNIAMADALFWIFAGCPMVLVFYSGLMQMDGVSAGLVALKQATNGVFNAVVAGLLLIAVRRWLPEGFKPGPRASFHSLVFYVLVLVASVSAAGMTVLESRREGARGGAGLAAGRLVAAGTGGGARAVGDGGGLRK